MKVLVACEFSGIVRDAFLALGLLDMVRGARFVLRHFTFKFTHTGGGEGRGKQDR